jgi:hypothetical protein
MHPNILTESLCTFWYTLYKEGVGTCQIHFCIQMKYEKQNNFALLQMYLYKIVFAGKCSKLYILSSHHSVLFVLCNGLKNLYPYIQSNIELFA